MTAPIASSTRIPATSSELLSTQNQNTKKREKHIRLLPLFSILWQAVSLLLHGHQILKRHNVGDVCIKLAHLEFFTAKIL